MLYVSDLDGTLLRNDGTLSPFSRTVIERLIRDGVLFTVASARSIVSIRQVLNDLPLVLPVIESNGAYISDYASGRHLTINPIGAEESSAVLATIRSLGALPVVSTHDGSGDRLYYEAVRNEGMSRYIEGRRASGDHRLREPCRLDTRLSEQVVCFTVIDRRELLQELQQDLDRAYGRSLSLHLFDDRYTGWPWLTIHSVNATKDRAIQTLKALVGVPESEITVFGDDVNDISMFRTATHAVAVENAQPVLKSHATEIIGPNSEDSVVRYLEGRHTAKRRA